MTNFYRKENILAHVGVTQYLRDSGVEVSNGRAVATWRDGRRQSVSVYESDGIERWKDHVTDEGGNVIDLFLRIEGDRPFLNALEELGDRYGLTPDKTAQKPKQEATEEKDGYALVATYTYRNEDGTPSYYVDRYERTVKDGKKEKTFRQRGPNSSNVRGIERTIYNLPDVIKASRVFICEGEKDCDTMTAMGLSATTNSGGATNWPASLNVHFNGKDTVVMADNDEKGQAHAKIVSRALLGVAKSVKVITISSVKKGDITEWMTNEGGTLEALMRIVDEAPELEKDESPVDAARSANEVPLSNYTEKTVSLPNGKTREVKIPRAVDDICKDISTRFLGFPKRIGGVLFDYTRAKCAKDRKIVTLPTHDDLHAWMNGTSGKQSTFATGCAFCTYRELKSRLLQTCEQFDVIAHAPWYPERSDAFRAYDDLPEPDPSGESIKRLMSFFLPATPADRTLMLALFMAPMFNTSSARPSWIIDTVDAQGSGKTTVVKACGWIYGEYVIDIDLKTMEHDFNAVKKRLLSSEGRKKRIALFDNVTSSIKSGNLANLVTAQSVSGMAPYGRGEETRKNDITWCATVNGATVDTDMATRSYFIDVISPGENADPMWEKKLMTFIEENRKQIHADMIYKLSHAPLRMRRRSRFGEFDSVVLSAACATDAEFSAADEAIRSRAERANNDTDLATQCVEAITNALTRHDQRDTHIRTDLTCAIRCTDMDEIMRRTSGGCRNWTSHIVRRFVNGGHIKNIVKGVDRISTADGMKYFGRCRCFLFSPCEDLLKDRSMTQFISFDCGVPKVLGVGKA